MAFDVLVRLLRFKGYEVTFVRNFTDVDDKIINRANEEGRSSEEVAAAYIEAFHEDMDRLGVRRADVEPRATEHITDMIDLCRTLLARGKAYAVPSGMCISAFGPFPGMASFPAGVRTICGPALASCPGRTRKIRLISRCGKRPSRASRGGKARGGMGGRAGTSNARP